MQSAKLALRTLAKAPSVTVLAVVSLALGIGANGAIFSLYDQSVLRPLPVAEPGRLVNFVSPGPKQGSVSCNQAGDCDAVFSYPMFRDLERAGRPTLSGVAAHRQFGANLAFDGETKAGTGVLVSGSYFPTLGLAPALGRLLGPEDDAAVGASLVAVLGHDAWRTRFGARTDIVGQPYVVNGHALEIVGVAPPGFRGTTLPAEVDVFVPITLRALVLPGFDDFEDRKSYWAYVFARLAPGVTREEAQVALALPYRAVIHEVEAPLQKGLSEETQARFLAKELLLEPGAHGQSQVRKEARTPLLLLFGVAGIVLLIACANVANLLLARSASRAAEMAVRLSIGASRGRLLSQLLLESCLLGVLGGLAGVVVARWTLIGIGRLCPPEAIAGLELELDLPVLAFAAALAIGTGILFGLYPALYATRVDLASTLKGQSGRTSGARAAARFRSSLVVAQIALSTALLVCAGLFAKSLVNVSRVELGIAASELVTFSLSPELNGYTPEGSRALFERAERELAAIPGVTSVTAALVPILGGNSWGSNVTVEGFEHGPDTDTNARFNEVGPGYFRTVGVPLLRGREITDADILGAPEVALVNEAFTRKFGLGSDAVGKRMARGSGDVGLDIEIVGVVEDAKYSEIKEEAQPLFFTPYRQDERIGSASFYLRTTLPPEGILAAVPKVVAGLDRNLPVENLKTMPQQIEESVFFDRVLTTLAASFATLATLLAAVGLYGVLAYTVSQRTRELGLRIALGADEGRIRRLILGQVGRLAAAGGVIGLLAALALGRAARSLLFELESHDPAVLVAATALIALVSLGAGLAPAMRAARVDPMRALRWE